MIAITILLSVNACLADGNSVGDTSSDSDSNADTDTDTETESDAATDTDSDRDEPEQDQYAQTGICGTTATGVATTDTFRGQEERYLIGDEGYGDDVCRVRYSLNVIGEPRTDCPNCSWAFDLQIADASIIAESESGCTDSSLALDGTAISELNGQQTAYGYVEEYMGHSSVIMRANLKGQWEAIAFASWNPKTGEFSYDRKDGHCGY